jgi:hypothetical protein
MRESRRFDPIDCTTPSGLRQLPFSFSQEAYRPTREKIKSTCQLTLERRLSISFDRPAISVISATLCSFCHERNAHAQKTKRDDEKVNSEAEIKIGWQEGSKKEAESHR